MAPTQTKAATQIHICVFQVFKEELLDLSLGLLTLTGQFVPGRRRFMLVLDIHNGSLLHLLAPLVRYACAKIITTHHLVLVPM